MITSPYEKYRQSSVQTSTPGQLLLKLYDGAIRFIKAGMEGLKNQDIQLANLNLGKAQTIVSELMSTLDSSYEVSKGLSAMYEYVNYLLVEANIKRATEPAEEALGYLIELRETWAEAVKLVPSQEVL
ncbi:flagellar export chaperone FliS [Paenibacillus illinoisensis]|uniref:Flagellar secretion chaperone FliS n=1 Tax=Paenibacillus illinoisensis TaxID=59845 RepID=A0ABW8HYH0_9BACL